MFARPLRPQLEAAVRNLDCDAARAKRLMRRVLAEDQAGFLHGAVRILRDDLDSPGAQRLIGVIASSGLLLQVLSDPTLPFPQALAVAQAASRLDPDVDVTLARALAAGTAAGLECDARLVEILAVISDGIRIFPSLVRLLRHSNPHIRSKAVLMIGRGNRSPKWLRQRLSDTDPRIRANAAEALWGIDTQEARELLQSLIHDSHNRVAGNAVVGLYRLGDASVIQEIAAMAAHYSPLFRATAAWVMGESGDPRFIEPIAGLLRDANAMVRKRAFSALANLRGALASAARGPAWRLSARLVEEPGKPNRKLMLGLGGPEGAPPPALLPTQVFVAEDGEPVLRYRAVERPLPETMSVVFLLPRGLSGVVEPALPWKRPSDLWACLYYAREMPPETLPEVSLRFHSSPGALAADLGRVPPANACLDVWHSLAAAVDPETGGLAGKRHVIVFSDAADRPAPGDQLRAAVIAGQAFLQVISSAPDSLVESFCRGVNGVFRLASQDAAIDACLALIARYEIAFAPVKPAAHEIKVRVHGPGLLAETALTLPSAAAAES